MENRARDVECNSLWLVPGREVEVMNEPEILPTLRAGDAARERIITRLSDALVSGHLDQGEYEVRLDVAVTSRTHAQLDRLVSDLPDVLQPAQQASRPIRNLRRPGNVRTALEAGAVTAGIVLGAALMLVSVILFSDYAWGAVLFLGGFFPWIVGLGFMGKVTRRSRARRRCP